MSVLQPGLVILQRKPRRPEEGSDLPAAPKLSQSGTNGFTLSLLGLNMASWPLAYFVPPHPVIQGVLNRTLFSSRIGKWGSRGAERQFLF